MTLLYPNPCYNEVCYIAGLSHWYPGSGVVLDCIDS